MKKKKIPLGSQDIEIIRKLKRRLRKIVKSSYSPLSKILKIHDVIEFVISKYQFYVKEIPWEIETINNLYYEREESFYSEPDEIKYPMTDDQIIKAIKINLNIHEKRRIPYVKNIIL